MSPAGTVAGNYQGKHQRVMAYIENLFLLLFAHALADFVLQPEAMGTGKNRNSMVHAGGGSLFPHWYYWMTGHALIHGGLVFMITGSIVLALVETLIHWLVDHAKCSGRISIHQDQAMHVACKFAYAALM